MKSKFAMMFGCAFILALSVIVLGFSGDASFAQNALVNFEEIVAAELPIPDSLKLFGAALICLVFLLKNKSQRSQ